MAAAIVPISGIICTIALVIFQPIKNGLAYFFAGFSNFAEKFLLPAIFDQIAHCDKITVIAVIRLYRLAQRIIKAFDL